MNESDPQNNERVKFFNVWNYFESVRKDGLPQRSADLFSQLPSAEGPKGYIPFVIWLSKFVNEVLKKGSLLYVGVLMNEATSN